MQSNKLVYILVATFFMAMLAGVVWADQGAGSMTGQTVYTCACGDGCNCNTVATEPGKCSCGKELMERQVLKDDGDTLYVCNCGASCNCTGVSADGTKCSCGKELKAFPKADKVGCACCRQHGSES